MSRPAPISPARARVALGKHYQRDGIATRARFALPQIPFAWQCLLGGLVGAAIGFLHHGRLF